MDVTLNWSGLLPAHLLHYQQKQVATSVSFIEQDKLVFSGPIGTEEHAFIV